MENKEVKIIPPEGYEIDKNASTFECIKFKPKSLTYEDVTRELFSKEAFYADVFGHIICSRIDTTQYLNPNNATSKKQLEKLLAINKLMNVAKYLNGDWKPKWGGSSPEKYYIIIDGCRQIAVTWAIVENSMNIYFKSRKLAQQAIDILGEETIRLALSTDW